MNGNFKCLFLVGHDTKHLEKMACTHYWHKHIFLGGGGGGGGGGGLRPLMCFFNYSYEPFSKYNITQLFSSR